MTGVAWRFGRFSLVGFMGALLQLTLVSLLTEVFRRPEHCGNTGRGRDHHIAQLRLA